MGSALVCVELGVGPMFEPNKFGGVGKKRLEGGYTRIPDNPYKAVYLEGAQRAPLRERHIGCGSETPSA